MKLIKHKTQLTTVKEFPGLINVKFEHDISSTKATFHYLGPPIPTEVWWEVISFFEWTYEISKSESQVRLFVNPVQKTWAAWAFPQEARTGMTAKELDDSPRTKEQRAQFADSDGWIYFGTVHHHCSCSAFQSGTDEWNEKTQDGLHITVGNIDKGVHDLHCRFYLNGACFDPDMSLFWALDTELLKLIPPQMRDLTARWQMGQSSRIEFPKEWKENLIEVKPAYEVRGLGYCSVGPSGTYHGGSQGTLGHNLGPVWERAKKCAKVILMEAAEQKFKLRDVFDVVEFLKASEIVALIESNLTFFDVDFDELEREWPKWKEAKSVYRKRLKELNGEFATIVGHVEVEDPKTVTLTEEEKNLLQDRPKDKEAEKKEEKETSGPKVEQPTTDAEAYGCD